MRGSPEKIKAYMKGYTSATKSAAEKETMRTT